eukprot:g45172.t1
MSSFRQIIGSLEDVSSQEHENAEMREQQKLRSLPAWSEQISMSIKHLELEDSVVLSCSVNIDGPGQHVGDRHSQELEALDHLHLSTIDADRVVFSTMLPEVDDQLLRFDDVDGEIV